jgi:hypothetical protein
MEKQKKDIAKPQENAVSRPPARMLLIAALIGLTAFFGVMGTAYELDVHKVSLAYACK